MLLDCGHELAAEYLQPGRTGGTGYGYDENNRKICYACCGERDKETLRNYDRWTGYIVKDSAGQWSVTNWPGSLAIKPFATKLHKYAGGFGADRFDVWFFFEGKEWHGIQRGDNQILRCRKLKRKRK